ncbi:MAG: thiamine pyrophosphate-binding protein [Alphaproteobacteria bacterium]|jgi:thiamine pyrophosphate-dependent acetolactate synthase large subunit-like protein|nr:MAG: thiamine pyrophosphate-binding protein [Alphaproteobacteria bacterium]HEU4358449.1 thiamine pyrophosphate-binding protein [Xanthobacteraceae bacterium]
MRDLVARYLSQGISRRGFVGGLTKAGLTATAAQSVLTAVASVNSVHAQGAGPQAGSAPAVPAPAPAAPAATAVAGVKPFQGTGGAAFAEQLIGCGVKYVFGNSASEDAQFYEALVDRPQLKYILTPHEGPGAAMAAGYIKASGEAAIVMQAAVVGMANAIGQMFNAFKEQTPLVVYSYRTDQTRRAGRDGFEEVANQEQMVQPITKYTWLARRPDMIPETVRRGFKAAWTPPYGPAYISWHSDYNDERVRTEIIAQELIDPRMRVRPNPDEIERAAKLLVEARMPLMVVGDEIYKAKAVGKAVKLAELLGMPVTQVRQLYANFPETHALWVGNVAGNSLNSLNYPKSTDVILNVGNKFQHSGPAPIVPRGPKFIDMRIDYASMGNVMVTEVPLVCDVGYGLDDLIAAIEQLLTPVLRQKAAERALDVRKFGEWAKAARAQVANNPDWNESPIIADRLTWEVAKFADPDAIIVHEAGSVALHSFDFDPNGGRELFFYYGAHLGSGVGTAAGVKLARPNQQVICLVGDGSFIFGPTALWNMARLELPVIVVVYNNHAYGGPHSRVIANVPGGRMVQTGQFVHDYLGSPDMNMAAIAKGFGVDGEVVESPGQLREALARARKATVEGKPYLIDAQVARKGVAWADKPWIPPIQVAALRQKKV